MITNDRDLPDDPSLEPGRDPAPDPAVAAQLAHDRPDELRRGDEVITTTHYDESRVGARTVEEGLGASTTHAEYGAGEPRFVLVGAHADDTGAVTVPGLLVGERTTIGSAVDSDIRLAGLEADHATVHHTDDDEYVLVLHAPAETSGAPNTELDGAQGHVLRTGFEVRLGEHALVFQRDESADHGRPFGGREGGEYSRQSQQPEREEITGTGPAPLPETPELDRQVE